MSITREYSNFNKCDLKMTYKSMINQNEREQKTKVKATGLGNALPLIAVKFEVQVIPTIRCII